MSPSSPCGILLVDPVAGDRRQLKQALETRGWSVWDVADGAAALRVYADRGAEIGAVVVDFQLPGFQGARVLAELGDLAPSLVRLAMTAEVPGYTTAAFRQISPTPLLTKPVRVGELDRLLRESIAPSEDRFNPNLA
jgi:CheY-like chemotaxis protein